jgi:enoyl-CoA hydratase/carnithine racemase
VKKTGALIEIVFNRPERRNALSNAMYDGITAVLEDAEADQSVRCILFAGAPGAFSAGNDLSEFISDPPVTDDAPVFRMLRALHGSSKILIAAVNGLAVGVGVTMLLHCDLVMASRDATFQLPFINLAIVPEAASSLLLPAMIGHQRAMELLLLGEAFDAGQAAAYGLVNGIYEPAELAPAVRATIVKILAKPPGALLAIKRLVRPTSAGVLERMAAENAALAGQIVSAEGVEAITALIEKRPPVFRG